MDHPIPVPLALARSLANSGAKDILHTVKAAIPT
jgi:hypothetical protein